MWKAVVRYYCRSVANVSGNDIRDGSIRVIVHGVLLSMREPGF